MTAHTMSLAWNNGYRAVCSCGKYRSRRYMVMPIRAQLAWE